MNAIAGPVRANIGGNVDLRIVNRSLFPKLVVQRMKKDVDDERVDVRLGILKNFQKLRYGPDVLIRKKRSDRFLIPVLTQLAFRMVFGPAARIGERCPAPTDGPAVGQNPSAVAHVSVMVGRTPGTKQSFQMRRLRSGGQQLKLRIIGHAEHAHISVTQRLSWKPFDSLI